MSTLQRGDVDRVARLARIALTDADAERLAPSLEAITRDFGTLAVEAARLAPAPDQAAGDARPDEVAPAPADIADAILKNARVDPATRRVRAHE